MATLNTRIRNKFGTATEWDHSDLELLKGELAIMPITGNDSTTVGYMIKVGNNTTFKNSQGLVAYAADVYGWAKDPQFDEGDYATGATGNLTKTHAAIAALQNAIGNGGSVGNMIKAAIDDLDVADSEVTGQFVTVVSETDGKISVTRKGISQADITEAVRNLARTDLVNIDAALTTVENSVADAKATIGGDYSKTKTVDAAITAIKSRIDTEELATTRIDGEIDALEGRMNTAEGDINTLKSDLNTASTGLKARVTTAEGEIDVLQAALAEYLGANAISTKFTNVDNKLQALENADDGLDTRLQSVERQIGGVTGAMHFIGAFTTEPTKNGDNPLVDGDVYVNTTSGKEFVYSGNGWVELGDVSDEKRRITAVENVLGSYTTAGSVKAAIEAEAQAREDADTGLNTKITNLTTTVTNNKTAADTKHGELQGEIDAVEALIGTGFSSATGSTVAAKLKATDDVAKEANSRSQTNATDIDALELVTSGYSGDKAIKTAVDAAQADATKANTGVTNLTNAIGTKDDSKEANTVYGAIAKHTADAAATYATQTALNGVSSRVTTIEGHYVYSDGTNLLNANGDVIIFDCGGVS